MRFLSIDIERFGALVNVDLAIATPRGVTAPSVPELAARHDPRTNTRRAGGSGSARKSRAKAPPLPALSLFPEAGAGVTVIHGPNEAGKTTLLRAIRFLLLGEDKTSAGKRAPSLAGGEAPSLRAVIELDTGSRVEIQRRRGKPAWVGRMLDGGDDVEEDWFMGAIGHPDASLFRNVFAFSLGELAAGAEVLKTGLLDGLLFGSGLGGSIQPSAILTDLTEAQAKLFTEKGQKQSVLLKLARIDQLKVELRAATTSSEELEKLDADIATKTRDVEDARARLRALHDEGERLSALANALEPFGEWRAEKSELEALGPVASLPASARVELEKARAVGMRVREEIAREEALVPELEATLAAASFDPRWLEAASDIEALDRAAMSYVEAERQAPERDREMRALDARTERRLGEIVPQMSLAKLRELSVTKAIRNGLAAAAAMKRATEQEGRELEVAIATARSEREALARDLAALPAPADADAAQVERVAGWLESYPDHQTLRERLEAVESELARATRSEVLLRAKLDPPPVGSDPATVPVPRGEEIDAFDRYLSEHDETLRALVSELRRTEQELATARQQIAEIQADGDVPTEGDLDRAREHRSVGWTLVVRTMEGRLDVRDEVDFAGETPLNVAFETAVNDADDIVDRMRYRADAVQRRAQKEAAAAHLETEMNRLGDAHAAAEAARATAFDEWTTLWQPTGVEPKSPAAMRAWLGDRTRWIDASEKLREVRALRAMLLARLEKFVAIGRKLLAIDGDLLQLRAEADKRLKRDKDRSEAILRIDAALGRADETIARGEVRQRARAEESARAEQNFASAWSAVGLELGAELSPGTTLDASVLDDLVHLRESLLEGEASIDARAAKHAEAAEAFRKRLSAVLSRVGRQRSAALVEGEVADLKKHLEGAESASRRASDARERLARIAREREARLRSLSRAEATLSDLRARAGVDDDTALEEATRRSERANDLVRAIESAERTLARVRGPWALDALLTAAAETSGDLLAAELRALEARREVDARSSDAALEDLATLRSRRSALDGSGRAADLLGDLASERAALRADVEEYAVFALAKALLERSIEEFERAHQPALIEEASKLFAEMTTGRYPRVRTTAKKEILVEHASGAFRAPDELSTGTNEQLFFALRLAYVTLYGARSEPLPIVLDDVLVNFDRGRAAATLGALGTFGQSSQVLFFTCHEHLVDLTREVLPGARVLRLA